MRHDRSLVLSSLLVVAAFPLVATGCGGGGSPKAGIASIGTTTTADAAASAAGGSSPGGELAEYSNCMRSHGVLSFPDAASFGSSAAIRAAKGQMARIAASKVSSATFQSAQRACAKYYGSPTSPTQVSHQEIQKLLAVSRCMRDHGLPNFPDPTPAGELNSPASISRNSPQALAALRACLSLGLAAGLGAPTRGHNAKL